MDDIMINYFNHHRRSGIDRRCGDDRRQVVSLDYFETNGVERRKYQDRRIGKEMRADWVRVNQWTSAPGNLNSEDMDHAAYQ